MTPELRFLGFLWFIRAGTVPGDGSVQCFLGSGTACVRWRFWSQLVFRNVTVSGWGLAFGKYLVLYDCSRTAALLSWARD